MLPHLLTLKNFMSYGEEPTTIDLRGMSVVCLSGDNGHGKSALLDAITWALWGETRLGRQNHEQLIRLGADEMSVVLEFEEGGATYRVRRQRSKRSGSQIWEVQILESGGSWRSVTGQGSGDTGRAIVQLLRMSYETFLNSAYLRQGHADEFVRQTANKRKEILAEILDLSRYDALEAKARTKMREAADRALDANREIQQIDAELLQEQHSRDALLAIDIQLAGLSKRQDEAQQRYDQLTSLRSSLTAQQDRLEEAQKQIAELDVRIKRFRESVAKEEHTIDNARQLIAEKDQIEAKYAQYEQAQADVERLQAGAQRFRILDRRRVELENQINLTRREIELSLKGLEERRKEATVSLFALPAMKQQAALLETSQAQHQPLTLQRQALWVERKSLADRFAEMKASKVRLEQDLAAAQERLQKIESQNESCSICGSPLPAEKLVGLYDECVAGIDRITGNISKLKVDGRQVAAEMAQCESRFASTEAEIKRLESERGELDGLRNRLNQLAEIEVGLLPNLDREITSAQSELQVQSYAPAEQADLALLLPELDVLRDTEKQLEAANVLIVALRPVERQRAQLGVASDDLEKATDRLAQMKEALEGSEKQHAFHAQSLENAPELDRQVVVNKREIDECRAGIGQMADECQRSQREQGRLQNQVERAEKIRVLRADLERAHQGAKNDEDLYTALAGSFSKRGVQALIIENALPDLQQDANELLERLTDGELSVTIQTTRLGKGKVAGDAQIETLDISIGDHLGSRPLEMYSGGESFRVSFALRIALSKLLTRRAGASLQTLIIDEGFGTQDAKGREKLVDAIMTIQEDFSQIIVITHVDELKDAFPNRIEVVKTSAGSEVTVVSGAALG